jgi:hypothetical protein
MAAFDRDAALERQQIHEISINVARRMLKVLDRSRSAPPHVAADIEASARAISDIQREIDQIMASFPTHGTLELPVLTHVLGSHRRALDMLEVLEARTADPRPSDHRSNAARAHAALLAAAREIEQDAQRQTITPPYGTPRTPLALAGQNMPGPGTPPRPGSFPTSLRQGSPPSARRPHSGPGHAPGRRPRTQGKPAWSLPSVKLPGGAEVLAFLTDRKTTAGFAVFTVVAGLGISALSLLDASGDAARRQAALSQGPKLDGRLGAAEQGAENGTAGSSSGMSAEAAPVAPPGTGYSAATDPLLEQPYLVVLTTRQTTEELHQDFRSLKGSYPEILGNAKARVDRIQGQDRQNWYRLSLIPPQSRADAKVLCNNLKAAGMTGCWIRPLPLGKAPQ